MAEHEPNPGSPHDLLRVGITLAAIAVALAALRPDSVAAPFFLLTGLCAAFGTGYAMVALWDAAGLTSRDLIIPRRRAVWWDTRYDALFLLTWATAALVVTYVVLLISSYY